MDTKELRFKDEVFAIVGAAMEVHRALGPGFLEGVYAEALALELGRANVPFDREVPLKILYKGAPLTKTYRADFIAYGVILIEVKASSGLGEADRAQLLNYLKATGSPVGVLLNFGHHPKLEWLRMVN